jgi:hypothetical protein
MQEQTRAVVLEVPVTERLPEVPSMPSQISESSDSVGMLNERIIADLDFPSETSGSV